MPRTVETNTSSPGDLELNIGAGHRYLPGFVNIDIDKRADVSLDLSREKLPFPDSCVRTIFSDATLEHIPDYLFALGEMHRVLQHDGALLLGLPYVTLTEHHLVNPYHLHNFSERSFDFFDPLRLKGSAAEENELAFRRVYVRYLYMGYWGLAPKPLRKWARRHLLNVVRSFDIALVAIKDPDAPLHVSDDRADKLQNRMAELRRMRRAYGDANIPKGRFATRTAPISTRVRLRLKPYRERRAT
jgi:SAM-dependent methyltransferase